MEFAHKASSFNHWCENVEEDLSEPVHCVSLNEIHQLQKDHKVFLASLVRAKEDFNYLLELDQQIKTLNVPSSPYTWLTMEVLDRMWKQIHDAIKVICIANTFLAIVIMAILLFCLGDFFL